MSDYIKRDDALNTLKPIVGIWDEDGVFRVDYVRVLSIIKNIPSADVVERKRGEWIYIDDWIYVAYKCSSCGEEFVLIEGTPLDNKYHFCPNCGADMREREGE